MHMLSVVISTANVATIEDCEVHKGKANDLVSCQVAETGSMSLMKSKKLLFRFDVKSTRRNASHSHSVSWLPSCIAFSGM